MNMDVFYVVISIIFVVLLLASIILWSIESWMNDQRKKIIASKIAGGRGMRLESAEALYLKVDGGMVEICEELPVAQPEAAPAPAAAEPAPVQPMAAEPAAEGEVRELAAEDASLAAKEERLDELVSRYGEITDDSVVFQAETKVRKTFIEKYAELTPEARSWYDEVSAYILGHASCKKVESSDAVTYKCKSDKVMRAVIKRGVVVLNFMLANTDLNRFVREEGIKKIKITPVSVRLETPFDVVLAKQTADITLESIYEEQRYRKDRRNELRRLNRKKKEQAPQA